LTDALEAHVVESGAAAIQLDWPGNAPAATISTARDTGAVIMAAPKMQQAAESSRAMKQAYHPVQDSARAKRASIRGV
jgi:hypothetical protein